MATEIKKEEWTYVKNCDNMYMISTFGNLKSKNKKSEWTKIGFKDNIGYMKCAITRNGVREIAKIHRLVGFAFIDNPQNKPEINHINGIKTDNRIENLEWCTRSENSLHAFRTGLTIYSEEQRQMASKRLKGKYGKDARMAKALIDKNTNIKYFSIKEAAIALDIKMKTLSARIIRDGIKSNFKFI